MLNWFVRCRAGCTSLHIVSQLFRTSLPHYLNLCFQQKKHYFFPFHDACTFRTDRGLQFVEEVSKLQTEQFIRFVSPLPYNLWDDGLLLGIAEHSSWTLKQSSSLRQLRWNSTQTISKTIRLGLRVALTRVVSQYTDRFKRKGKRNRTLL